MVAQSTYKTFFSFSKLTTAVDVKKTVVISKKLFYNITKYIINLLSY